MEPDVPKWEAFGWHFPLTPLACRDARHEGSTHTAQGNNTQRVRKCISLLCYVCIPFQTPTLAGRLVFTKSLILFVKWQQSLQRHLTTEKHQYHSINSIILAPAAVTLFFLSLRVHQDEKGQTKSIPEPDDFIGQQTVREQNGNVKARRQPKVTSVGD